MEAGQQPRCQRFPLTESEREVEKKHKKEETKKQGGEMCENESAPAANPKAVSPSSATFTLICVCVCTNLGHVEMEFDKAEIDSRALDAGVTGLYGRIRPRLRARASLMFTSQMTK